MSHVLVIALEYKRYHRDAVIRIFADERLVDETILSHNITSKTTEYKKEWLFGDNMLSSYLKTPTKLFMYQIDNKFLNNNIKIQVDNDNSNYTNGFINNFSWIMFTDVFLIPTCLLQEKNWRKLSRFRVSKNVHPGWPIFLDLHMGLEIKHTTNPWPHSFINHQRGGSFTVEIPLCKKYKVIHLGKKIPSGKLGLYTEKARILRVFNALNTTVNEDK